MISSTYRIYPKKQEEERLEFSLEMCRIAYNYLLERLNNNVKGRTALAHSLLALKKKDTRFEQVYAKAVQPQCDKLCFNLRALSQLKNKGHQVGRLRFKGKGWFKSFSYNQAGFKIFDVHGKTGEEMRIEKEHIELVMNVPHDKRVKALELVKQGLTCGDVARQLDISNHMAVFYLIGYNIEDVSFLRSESI